MVSWPQKDMRRTPGVSGHGWEQFCGILLRNRREGGKLFPFSFTAPAPAGERGAAVTAAVECGSLLLLGGRSLLRRVRSNVVEGFSLSL